MYKFPRQLLFRAAKSNAVYQRRNVCSLNEVVTIVDAKKMPKHYNEMPGELILTMAINGTVNSTQV